MPINRVYLENFRLFKKKDLSLSEDKNFIPWSSNPIEVEVIDGLFSVRLGKFEENVDALDSAVFTGNDGAGRRRFLLMEVCSSDNLGDCKPYNANNYRGFYQKDSNQNFNSNTVDSQIPIPGVPFVVSAVRVVGDDTKEGTLRISKELDSDEVANDFLRRNYSIDGKSLNNYPELLKPFYF